MRDDWVELAHKYTMPTLDIVDQKTGDRIPIYLFTEENFVQFLNEFLNRNISHKDV